MKASRKLKDNFVTLFNSGPMTFTSSSILKNLLILFLVVAGLHYAKEFLMPLALGAVLATLFLPFCKWLEGKKLPRAVAVFVCVFILLTAIAAIGALLGWQIAELTDDIALIKQKAGQVANSIQQNIIRYLGITVKEQTQLLKDQQSAVGGLLQTVAGSMADVFTGFILTMVYVFLLLYYRNHIKNFILKLFPAEQKSKTEKVIISATNVTQQYLAGLSKMIVLLWVMYFIGFSIVGVKNAIFFAVLCGLLEIVPFIGNLTGSVVTILVSAVNGASAPMIGGIVLTYGTVQFIQGWVLEPLIVGAQVKINPMVTIVALVLGELVWGIPGVILAIPLIAMLKIVCDHIEPLKPFGFLIGEVETAKAEPGFIKKVKSWFK